MAGERLSASVRQFPPSRWLLYRSPSAARVSNTRHNTRNTTKEAGLLGPVPCLLCQELSQGSPDFGVADPSRPYRPELEPPSGSLSPRSKINSH